MVRRKAVVIGTYLERSILFLQCHELGGLGRAREEREGRERGQARSRGRGREKGWVDERSIRGRTRKQHV